MEYLGLYLYVLHHGLDGQVRIRDILRPRLDAPDDLVHLLLGHPLLLDGAGEVFLCCLKTLLCGLFVDVGQVHVEAGLREDLCDAAAHLSRPDDLYLLYGQDLLLLSH